MPRPWPVHLIAVAVLIGLTLFVLRAIGPALPPLNRKLNWVSFRPDSHHYSEFSLGWYTHKGIRLYVGKGLGMSGMKLRFNARPELVMLQFV